MFENLSEKLDAVFKKLKGRSVLDEDMIKGALRDIRLALLEADVNFRVVKEFVEDVRLRALGQNVLESISPGHQVVKIVNDRLIELMSSENDRLNLSNRSPAPLMLVGLQGSGKTTTAAKLAGLLIKKGRRVLLVSADIYRPAAVEQLRILAEKVGAGFCDTKDLKDPVAISVLASERARNDGYDTLIIDTAGRLHIDQELMLELERIKGSVNPSEILLVADAMTGQDAVNVAENFDSRLSLDGVILTKMDGDARGGAALSLRKVTGKPVKFVGKGEKLEDIEVFDPERMASRILGMGDILTLVEKAQQSVNERDARDLERKIRKEGFTLEDLKTQLNQIRKMGPLQEIMGMIPGFGKMKALKNASLDEKEFTRTTAIIDSMTREERFNHKIIDGQRRKRIARGSGTTVQDVNRLMKNYMEMKKMMKKLNKGGMKQLMRGNLSFK